MGALVDGFVLLFALFFALAVFGFWLFVYLFALIFFLLRWAITGKKPPMKPKLHRKKGGKREWSHQQ